MLDLKDVEQSSLGMLFNFVYSFLKSLVGGSLCGLAFGVLSAFVCSL